MFSLTRSWFPYFKAFFSTLCVVDCGLRCSYAQALEWMPLKSCIWILDTWSKEMSVIQTTSIDNINQKILTKAQTHTPPIHTPPQKKRKKKKKRLFPKFQLIPSLCLQVMHDYVHWYCFTEYLVKSILVILLMGINVKTSVNSHWNQFCLIPLG